MNGPKQSLSRYLSTLTTLHLVLIISQAVLGVVLYLQTTSSAGEDQDLYFALQIAAPLVAFLSLSAGGFVMRTRLGAIRSMANLEQKLQNYRTTLIIRFAMLEGASVFSFVSYYLTGNMILLGVGVLVLLVFIIQRPTKAKVAIDLELTVAEKEMIF